VSRTFKAMAAVLAIVAVLTLAVTQTIHAFEGDRCGCADSGCAEQRCEGCTGSGHCGPSGNCAGAVTLRHRQPPLTLRALDHGFTLSVGRRCGRA
jgi:hypothetical protein